MLPVFVVLPFLIISLIRLTVLRSAKISSSKLNHYRFVVLSLLGFWLALDTGRFLCLKR